MAVLVTGGAEEDEESRGRHDYSVSRNVVKRSRAELRQRLIPGRGRKEGVIFRLEEVRIRIFRAGSAFFHLPLQATGCLFLLFFLAGLFFLPFFESGMRSRGQ